MKNRYRSVKVGSRGGMFYCEDTGTGKRVSLRTKDEEEAERLINAKNDSLKTPLINRQIGMAYLSSALRIDLCADERWPEASTRNCCLFNFVERGNRTACLFTTVAEDFYS